MTAMVKSYLEEKKILEKSFVTPLNGAFVTKPIKLGPSLNIAFYLGVMEPHYNGSAEMLKEKEPT